MLRWNAQWQGLIRVAAWILVALIAAVTLVPIGLRPVVTADPSFERVAAYAVAGLLMTVAYPRHWPWILAGTVVLAGGLEAGQTLTGTRHGRFDDFLVKAAAGLVGALAGRPLAILADRHRAGGTVTGTTLAGRDLGDRTCG
ncbi:hypothetical protein ACXR8U_26405 [Methylobacterium radiotolerans]|jgi:hypothetical protein|uniref:hypothetical protein n=1 Tax=Methylobacterium TaxID=407 RepID=UPI0005E3D683|nr:MULTISPECIES: hypothetical protein [Methylobacterium]GAN49426.1 hypothetical protein ME121_3454 [Methylobacterium sp. ME121]KZC02770.1 hypothetical protein AU375_01022 [Methylobacterium radiotolerans]MBN6821377.1 hypothetical protein [Methylobacterium organophilum]OXE39795.1 hypothetical protein CCS92_22140 [Methylobacterium radiotolerans]RUP21662.1 MAG: hypothetical protein EKK44_08425 [Methylobacterium sp.]